MISWILNFVLMVFALLGVLLAYGLIENQVSSDRPPFIAHLLAIMQVVLNPDRAKEWVVETSAVDSAVDIKTWHESGNAIFWKRVFPDLDGGDKS